MVLLSPNPDVKDVLDITGVPAIIPLYYDFKSATAALKG
jgi:hypothetical protein